MFRKIILKIVKYIKYPNQLKADFYTAINLPVAKRLGVEFYEPNYIYFNRFTENSVVIDIGCGYKAELSKHLIDHYHVRSFAFDPTLKHEQALKSIEDQYKGKFSHLKFALASEEKEIQFFETLDHESGSLHSDHKNILNDHIRSYTVKAITLNRLPAITGCRVIDYIKIDIEGEEYNLFDQTNKDDLSFFKQIFIEFHHLSIRSYSYRDTKKIVRKLKGFGLKCFSLDKINYLFYRD